MCFRITKQNYDLIILFLTMSLKTSANVEPGKPLSTDCVFLDNVATRGSIGNVPQFGIFA